MSAIAYADAPVPVREDLVSAQQRAWERIARPGAWWSGRERVAIAAEVRAAADCALCRERKAALSPHAVDGLHDSLGELPEVAVDVVHRVTTDPARLSRAWFEKALAGGLGDAPYVEIVGVVVQVITVDRFCRGLGVPLRPLPEPLPGEPSRRRPEGLEQGGAWVPWVVKPAGPDADLYAGAPGGRVVNVVRALSLVPDEVRALRDMSAAHYVPYQKLFDPRAGRSLDRAQMELLAARVSALNECFY